MPSAAPSTIVDHPTPTRPLPVPSPLTTSSEGFIAGEMAILQAKLKKSFALNIADFHATKHTSTAVTSTVNLQQPNKSTDIHPPTPIVPSQKSEECIAGNMAKLKKWLYRPTVRMNISSRYIRHFIPPIDPHATISEKLKKKRQALLARQHDNAAAKKKKATKRARQLKVQAAEKAKHQATESTNATKRSNQHFQTMILGMLQSMK